MWRRVPSGLRFVHAAFNATDTSSTNLRGKTPALQGLFVIFEQAAAQPGSHWRSCSKASSQGPAFSVWPGAKVSPVFAASIDLSFIGRSLSDPRSEGLGLLLESLGCRVAVLERQVSKLRLDRLRAYPAMQRGWLTVLPALCNRSFGAHRTLPIDPKGAAVACAVLSDEAIGTWSDARSGTRGDTPRVKRGNVPVGGQPKGARQDSSAERADFQRCPRAVVREREHHGSTAGVLHRHHSPRFTRLDFSRWSRSRNLSRM